ncbi:MAG: NAD(P)H-binding protein [Bacteroidota bacterium]|nr:NAD(P)H-binding protein [Bacteroidota bacterium]
MDELSGVVIGATGLTGNLLVNELLKDNSFKNVRVLVRRPLNIIHPKLQQEIVNFNDIDDYSDKFGEGDIIFCCIGTTQKKVKNDKTAYEKIDYAIPVNAARIGLSKNFKKYLIISSIGANENSSNFYLKLKGRTENKIKEFPYNTISIFRPGQLLGKRNENRRGEAILQNATKFISYFLFGSLKKYHSINAIDVAKAMVKESKLNNHGVHYFEYTEIMDLAHN